MLVEVDHTLLAVLSLLLMIRALLDRAQIDHWLSPAGAGGICIQRLHMNYYCILY
jgi:hypothetical protein